MKRAWLAVLCLGLLATFTPSIVQAEDTPSSTYYVPPTQFNASLQIMDLGFSNIIALFQNATGSFTLNGDGTQMAHIRVALDTNSLMTANPGNLRDLAQLLDVRQYSEIRIVAADPVTLKDGKADVTATVTVHGQTKQVTMQATLNHRGKTPGGMFSGEGEAAGLSLHGAFKRADFGMGGNPDVGPSANGGVDRFGDMITLTLEMQALRQ